MEIYLSLQIVMVHWDINKSFNMEYLVEQRTQTYLIPVNALLNIQSY